MRIKGLRYPLIIAVVVIVFALLITGQWAYKVYFLEQPVIESLNSLKEVQSVEVDEEVNAVEINLKEVNNLKEIYRKIEQKLKRSGSSDLEIIIFDNRSSELDEAFYQSHFFVHQAVIQGDFVKMKNSIAQIAEKSGIEKVRLFIGDKNIYLQFHKGNNYLYEIINRNGSSGSEKSSDGSD